MLEDCITSFIDGRVRLRHMALREEAAAERARAFLAAVPGVRAARANHRSGSLLLEYDPEQLDRKALSDVLRQAQERSGIGVAVGAGERSFRRCLLPGGISRAKAVRFVNRSMLATLAASLAFLLAGQGRGHVIAGSAFLVFNAAHLYTYRKSL